MRRTGKISLCVVTTLSLLLLLLNFNMKPEPGDEGVLAMDGWRISRGEVPHRDFFQFIPPLAAYLQASFFKLFGISVFSLRLPGLLYGALLLLSAFLLGRRFMKEDLFVACWLSIIVPFGVASWLFGSHHWLCDILQAGGAAALIAALRMPSGSLAAAAGALFGLAAFTLQDQGGYLAAGLLAGSLLVKGKDRRLLLLAVISSAAAFLLAALPLAVAAGPSRLYEDWIAFPLFSYRPSAGHSVTVASFIRNVMKEWDGTAFRVAPLYAATGALNSTFMMISPLLSAGSLALLWLRKALPRRDLVVLSAVSLAFLFAAFHRLAVTNLLWAFASLLPFFIALEICSRGKRKTLRAAAFAAAFLLLGVSIGRAVSMAGFALRKERLTVVQSRAGSYKFINSFKGRQLDGLIGSIEARVPPGEPLFCAGYIPLVNFLTQTPNPTRFNFMVGGDYYTKEQTASWQESLLRSKTKWGVSEKIRLDETMGRKVLPGFEPVYVNELYILWERKGSH